MKKLLVVLALCLIMLPIASLAGGDDIFATYKFKVTNQTNYHVKLQVYWNEPEKESDLIGIPAPYINMILKPRQVVYITLNPGDNSVIEYVMEESFIKSRDIKVPDDFKDDMQIIMKRKTGI
jgi:hypothetical protein